ncbi:MAG: response regulator [Candidatus Kerfeldbacteria bacterium]
MGTKKTILIVEDERSVIRILHDKFTDEGFNVIEASNGEEGLKFALSKSPDLILLDIIMPRLDGISMLRKLREDPKGADIPVIILTNLSDETQQLNLDDTHVLDYLIKTDWSLEDVVSKAKKHLGQ